MGLFDSLFGGGKSSSSQQSFVDPKQAPYLASLYQQAAEASRFGMAPLQQLGGALQQQGQDITNSLQGIGQQQQGPFAGALANYAQAGNPFAQAQIGQLGQGLGRLFQQQIAPTIGSYFGGTNTYGNDRHALALGQAGEGLGQQFLTGALGILGNSAQLGVQAAGMGQQGQIGSLLGAQGGLGGLFDLGQAGTFGSLPGYAGLIGNPTILGQGSSSSRQTGGILPALSGLFNIRP